MKQRTVRFTHIMSGREKNVAIAHIYYDGVFYECSVVRYPDVETGTWSHSLGYYKQYEDAKERFFEYLQG